jgi:hypothetical protein
MYLGLKWNFAKFLVNRDGVPIQRYLPTSGPKSMEKDILKLLSLPDIPATNPSTTPSTTTAAAAAEETCASTTDASTTK